jgi:hypothetical protein
VSVPYRKLRWWYEWNIFLLDRGLIPEIEFLLRLATCRWYPGF